MLSKIFFKFSSRLKDVKFQSCSNCLDCVSCVRLIALFSFGDDGFLICQGKFSKLILVCISKVSNRFG